MTPRNTYLVSWLALLAVGALALSGDPLGVIAVVVLAWFLLSIVGWEAAHR